MLYCTDETVEQTGEYSAYSACGTVLGTVSLKKGAVFPPILNGLCFYEKLDEKAGRTF